MRAHTPYLRPLTQPEVPAGAPGPDPRRSGELPPTWCCSIWTFQIVDVAGQVEALRQRRLLTDEQAAAVETAALGAVSTLPTGGGDPHEAEVSCGSTASPC